MAREFAIPAGETLVRIDDLELIALGERVRAMPPGAWLIHGHDGTWDQDSFPDDGKRLCGSATVEDAFYPYLGKDQGPEPVRGAE